MKAIHADPKEIRKVFSDEYIIPDFQRPYSWEKEHCEKLWEDFISFFESKRSADDRYFLGNIVIHEVKGTYAVIDGQQRLTTILLLIKSLHNNAATVKALEACLKIKNKLTEELTNEPRIKSHVISNDCEDLTNIINNNSEKITSTSNFKLNYDFFLEKIEKWRQKNLTSETFNSLILTLLDNIVLLPIHCESEDDALTIFETINNRGMALTDADIFKAKLYQKVDKNKKEDFIQAWNDLSDHEWLFRIMMHIRRAEDNDISKETGLRSYFTASGMNRLDKYADMMKSLKLVNHILEEWEGSSEVMVFWKILESYPNQYWNYPLYVFLHKHGQFVDNEGYTLGDEQLKEFVHLLKSTIKYFYIKGIVHNSVNSVKDTVFKVCAAIEQKQDYLQCYWENISDDDLDEFKKKIQENKYGRYLKGLVLLTGILNPQQNIDDYKDILTSRVDIEHILPKKWNNYDKWTEDLWKEKLNTLGNLIPLEKALNISASNEFFDRKKTIYQKSKIQDAKDFQGTWYPTDYVKNHSTKLERLFNFFTGVTTLNNI